jgi:hypothetical protein
MQAPFMANWRQETIQLGFADVTISDAVGGGEWLAFLHSLMPPRSNAICHMGVERHSQSNFRKAPVFEIILTLIYDCLSPLLDIMG